MQLTNDTSRQIGVSVPRKDHHLGHAQYLPAEGNLDEYKENGRGGWIRTNAWQDQNLLPYRLATPLYLLLRTLMRSTS